MFLHRGIAQSDAGQLTKQRTWALYSDTGTLFKDLAHTKSKVRGQKVEHANPSRRHHPPGSHPEGQLQASRPGTRGNQGNSRPGTQGNSRPGTQGSPSRKHRMAPEQQHDTDFGVLPPPVEHFPTQMHLSASASTLALNPSASVSTLGLGSSVEDSSLQATLRPGTGKSQKSSSQKGRGGNGGGFPFGFKRLLHSFGGSNKSASSKPAKVKQATSATGIVPDASWNQFRSEAIQTSEHGAIDSSGNEQMFMTWPMTSEDASGGETRARSPVSLSGTMRQNPLSESIKSLHSHYSSTKSLFSASVMSSQPETLDPETEIRMKEAAYALADRYKGGMDRLNNAQADWRRKHDAWMKRRQNKDESQKKVSKEYPMIPEDSPTSDNSGRNSYLASQEDAVSKIVQRRSVKAALPHHLTRKSAQSNQGPTDWAKVMSEIREGQQLDPKVNQSEDKPKRLGISREPTIQSDTETGLDYKLPEGRLQHEHQPETFLEKEPELKRFEKSKSHFDPSPCMSHFDLIVSMSKKFQLTVAQVKSEYASFTGYDKDGSGLLDREEFLDRLRHTLKIPPGSKIPKHLIQKEWAEADVDGDGQIDFEEYLTWSQNVAFSRELLGKTAQEEENQELSTKHGVPLIDIEVIRKGFDKFDEDQSGEIDKEEFKGVLLLLLKAKDASDLPDDRLERYWKEVDEDHSGVIEFEEFLLWYLKYFFVPVGDRAGRDQDPTTQAYAKLGVQRLRPLFTNSNL